MANGSDQEHFQWTSESTDTAEAAGRAFDKSQVLSSATEELEGVDENSALQH